MGKATLSTGRLGNQFANLAGRIAHTHPIVGNLATILGDFAVGGLVTAGVLGGVAAIAVVFDKLTESTRKAKEEQGKLVEKLREAIHLKGLGPGGETVDQVAAANARAAAIKTQITALEALIVKDAQDADVMASNLVIQDKINKLYAERQNLLNVGAGGQSIVNEKVNEAIAEKAREAAAAAEKHRREMEKIAEAARRYADYLRNLELPDVGSIISVGLGAGTKWGRAGDALVFQKALDEEIKGQITNPDMSGLTSHVMSKEQIAKLNESITHADANAQTITEAIMQSASVIVNALNIGGGGRGSQVGSAIGGIVGMAAGTMIGRGIGSTFGNLIAPGIGGLIGGMAGSFLGGLFDHHKKAVNQNTQAIKELTSELRNAPSGFKVAATRYSATDVYDAAAKGAIQRSRRGGAMVLAPTL